MNVNIHSLKVGAVLLDQSCAIHNRATTVATGTIADVIINVEFCPKHNISHSNLNVMMQMHREISDDVRPKRNQFLAAGKHMNNVSR